MERTDHSRPYVAADPGALEESLEHHGIKGMKWGVRKQRTGSGTSKPEGSTSTPTKASSGDSNGKLQRSKQGRIEVAPKGAGGKPNHMSDEELRQIINRINLERQFTQLTTPPPSRKDEARNLVGEVLKDVGKQQLKILVGVAATAATGAALKKAGLPAPKGKKK